MEIKDLEERYTVHIEKKDEYYYAYNYFGRLIARKKSLSDIRRELEEYFKEGKSNGN